jgi:hypothetical protein
MAGSFLKHALLPHGLGEITCIVLFQIQVTLAQQGVASSTLSSFIHLHNLTNQDQSEKDLSLVLEGGGGGFFEGGGGLVACC